MTNDIRPEKALEHNTNTLNYWVGKMKQSYCANNELEVTMPEIKDGKATRGDIAVKEGACSNHRRNGSKFCQKCSDEHNGIEHVPEEPKKVVVHKGKEVCIECGSDEDVVGQQCVDCRVPA